MHFNEPNCPETVEAAAARLYPGLTFDTALPQQWVDTLCSRDLDPRGHFVWLYATGHFGGRAAPVTPRGIEIASICATYMTMQTIEDLRIQVADLIRAEFPIGNPDREYLLALVPNATTEELLRTRSRLHLEIMLHSR